MIVETKNLRVVYLTANAISGMSRDQAFAYFLGLLEGDGNFHLGFSNDKCISCWRDSKKTSLLRF